MINVVARYRSALKKQLRCNGKAKKRLLNGFDQTLTAYLEEHTNPTVNDLTIAFGPPNEMAEILMAELTNQEQTQYRRNILLRKLFLVAFALVFLVLTIYIWFFKTTGLTVVDSASYLSITEETNAQHTEERTYTIPTEGTEEYD